MGKGESWCGTRINASREVVKAWKGSVLAGLAMYLLVFWDHIPTLAAHKYYCNRYAGFTVYKTLKEWSKENPGIAETLRPDESIPTEVVGNRRRYDLNQRFVWDVTRQNIFLSIKRSYNEIIDKQNGEIIARYIDFSAGYGNLLASTDPRAYKFWLTNSSCEAEGKRVSERQFFQFEQSVEDPRGDYE